MKGLEVHGEDMTPGFEWHLGYSVGWHVLDLKSLHDANGIQHWQA